ncbi:hypothetical protein [Roseofilum casamattae]|uniref:Serine kinase n=1 Tax=Roseofilum casamattae BLCC-M143 TaxID=3022442 RepID=A0ABT7BRV2_9CYAN|nr:hypothetical protein [Roseofilum casamattae]MDJ1181921.1 hypothetical protein [Roseofilum casamattae BLCC-M143]
MTLYRYRACGLNIVSELACPELRPHSGNGSDFDVRISVGPVSDRLVGAVYEDWFSQIKPGAYLLKVNEIAKYLAIDGKEIIIDPAAGCPEDLIRLYLFSQGFGALLHQRGHLVFHASAIDSDRGAVIFLGPSGAGKSTLAAGLLKAGYPILADDLCVVGCSPDREPQVFPALAQIRLWNDALQQLDYDRQTMQRVWHKEDKYTKYLSDLPAGQSSKLHGIYLLEPADVSTVSVISLTKVKQFEVLMRNVFRMECTNGLGVGGRMFQQVSQVLNHCQVKQVIRPQSHFCLDEVIECLEEDIARTTK